MSDNREYRSNYNTKKRLASFGHQLEEVHNAKPATILEIGIGAGLVSHVLSKDYSVTTLDISSDLSPHCVGSVTNLPFLNSSFDLVLCCEVLEHIPFQKFEPALAEMNRVATNRVILSLPDKRPFWAVQIPYIRKLKIKTPFFSPPEHEFDGEHYWEINSKDHETARVKNVITSTGFKIERDYQVFENYKHHFFILTPESREQ